MKVIGNWIHQIRHQKSTMLFVYKCRDDNIVVLKNNEFFKIMKVSIGVFGSCHNDQYRQQIDNCKQTWCKDVENVFFFCGINRWEKYPDLVHFDCQDDELSATYKQWNGMKWLHQHSPSDFYFIVGTDTFVVYKNLIKMLANYDPNQHAYIGGHGDVRKLDTFVYFHSGGSGFIITHKTMQMIIDKIDDHLLQWTALCHRFAQYLIYGCDVSIAYLLMKHRVPSYTEEHFYGCNHKGFAKGKPCCNHIVQESKIISCHYMNGNEMNELYKKIHS